MIQQYSSDWLEKYKSEADVIKHALGSSIIEIEHIGSTAVPNLSAKPIIDIAVLTESISDTESFIEKLEKIGYSYKPEMSSQERIFLRKGNPVEFHLSITEPKYSFLNRQILFRDYLRNHPEVAKEYEDLKHRIVKDIPEEKQKDLSLSDEYNNKKGPFIQNVLKLAQAEKLK